MEFFDALPREEQNSIETGPATLLPELGCTRVTKGVLTLPGSPIYCGDLLVMPAAADVRQRFRWPGSLWDLADATRQLYVDTEPYDEYIRRWIAKRRQT